jgi:hypothetical protein
MMLLLLSIFPILWINREFLKNDFHFSKIMKDKSTLAFLSIFWIAQNGPFGSRETPHKQEKEGSFLSTCLTQKYLARIHLSKYKNKTIEVSDYNYDEGYRIGCDPWFSPIACKTSLPRKIQRS